MAVRAVHLLVVPLVTVGYGSARQAKRQLREITVGYGSARQAKRKLRSWTEEER